MRKAASSLLVVVLVTALLLSANVLVPEIVHADTTGGWYLIESKYHLSSSDFSIKGAIRNTVMGTTGYIYDTYTGEGNEGNMTFMHSRVYDNGKEVAHIKHQVIWDTPPAYLAPNEKTGFNIEARPISSNSWGQPTVYANFDMGDINPGGATAGSFYFVAEDGNYAVVDKKVYLESKKVIPQGRPGDKRRIVLNLGHNYGYTYTYEWRELPPPVAAEDTIVLEGEWNISANNSRGKIDINNQNGSKFSGTVHIDSGRTEQLINGNISGNTITFTRMWDDWDIRQDYSGTLTIDANGNAKIEGTFTQNNKAGSGRVSGPYSWTATKVIAVPKKPTTPAPSANGNAEAFESGSRIMWQPAAGLGYRLFRSTSQGNLGISVTDFYITSTSYADVNVEPNTTYYYTVKPVIEEANSYKGIEEKLGNAIATYVVKTGNSTYKPGSYKHFIMLKLESPNMNVDGIEQEVDPGRGTMPLVIAGRTMVPIRAVVEAMGGTVEWDGSTQKITLKARGNTVEMWMGKTDIKVNGASKNMDVAPASKNSRTFVPVRFAAENLSCKVDWINSTKEAVIVYEE